jgi:hypothetical protein
VGDARALGRLLVACVLSDGEPVDERVVRDAGAVLHHVVDAADHHGISMAVYRGLANADLPDVVSRSLRAHFDYWTNRNTVMTLELARIAKVIDAAGCRWLALKGPVLAEGLYPRNDLRTYADLDVLIDRRDFSAAVTALEAVGGVGVEQDWELVLQELKGELNFALPSAVVIDLHWSLLYNATIRSQFSWNDDEVLDRRVDVSLSPRVRVPTLDPTDTAIHLALHACLTGGHKLCWKRDVFLAMEAVGSFDDLVLRARAQNVGLPVGIMLSKVRRTFGAVPWDRSVEDSLCGGARWVDVVQHVDRIRPSERWHGGSLTGHLVCGATRSTTKASIRELADRVRFELGVVRTDSGHPWRQRFPMMSNIVARPPRAHRPASLAFRDAYLVAIGSVAGR